MANQNFFALLLDDENEPSSVIAHYQEKPAEKKVQTKEPISAVQKTVAKLPTKPPPPSEAVREAQQASSERGRGRGRGQGRGGRGGPRGDNGYGDQNRDRKENYTREGPNGSLSDQSNFERNRNSDGYRGGYYGGRGRGRSYNAEEGTENGGRTFEGGRGRGGRSRWSGEGDENNQEGELAHINENSEEAKRASEVGRGRGRGRGRGGFRGGSGDNDEFPRRREYDRRSGTGRGHEMKREGSGRGNWGTELDQNPTSEEKVEVVPVEEPKVEEGDLKIDDTVAKELPVENGEVKKVEEEDNEMTLDEYEKVLEEKRKALGLNKAEERKVKLDKSFESMQLVEKKNEEDVFIKLGFEKDLKGKKKEAEKDEKARKPVSINQFLKPADGGEGSYGGRPRRGRGGNMGGFNNPRRVSAPLIEDPGQFPTLGGK